MQATLTMNQFRRYIVPVVALLVVAALIFSFRSWWTLPRLTEDEIRQVAVTTIQREVGQSFYITGYLDVVATVTATNQKVLFPDLFDIDLGTTSATVRVPGRVSYGFDVGKLRPEAIRVGGDGVVEVTLPDLQVYAIEPRLSMMEVRTDVGWARTKEGSGRQMEQRALQEIETALRKQGESYLRAGTQPRVNTAHALERMLEPPLRAAGIADPQFRFVLGSGLVLEPEG